MEQHQKEMERYLELERIQKQREEALRRKKMEEEEERAKQMKLPGKNSHRH
jgi:arginine/glutamate-rich protein 1